jgi:hypothetical protein
MEPGTHNNRLRAGRAERIRSQGTCSDERVHGRHRDSWSGESTWQCEVRACFAWLDFNAGCQGKCRRARELGGEPRAKMARLILTRACYQVKGVVDRNTPNKYYRDFGHENCTKIRMGTIQNKSVGTDCQWKEDFMGVVPSK